MKSSKLILALGACTLLMTGTAPFAQEEDDGHILEITQVEVKIGHDMAFREAVKAYHQCLHDHGYEGAWSTWSNVDGHGRKYHFVSSMDNWAELDSRDEAGETCWSEHHDSLTSHVTAASTHFARHITDWSGDAEGYTVVRLHQFRVEDNGDFRDTVGTITSILKEAEYAHLGTWYQNIGNDSNEPGYFVVAHFDNFAAMDEDRSGPYDALVDAVGQERADELWEQFNDALRDDREYFTDLLRLEEDLSHSHED